MPTPIVDFTPTGYTVDPILCLPDMVYSCEVIMGPTLDICDVNDVLTQASIDPVTGRYTFQSTDMAGYPAGTYTLQITGTVGLKSATQTIEVELVDPCPTAALTLLPSPFVDDSYTLRDP